MTESVLPEDPCDWLRANQEPWQELAPKLRKWSKSYRRNHCEHYRSVARLIREQDVAAGGRVLDVGAVPGHLSAYIASGGFDVSVADLDPSRMDPVFAAFGIATRQVDVEREDLPYEDESFDLVLLCQILEHLRLDPIRPLTEVRRLLAPGGVGIVSVPQITPHMRWRFLRGDDLVGDPVWQQRKMKTVGHPGDSRLYSRPQMERMLAHAELEVVRVVPGGGLRARGDRTLLLRLLWRLARSRMQANLYFIVRPATG